MTTDNCRDALKCPYVSLYIQLNKQFEGIETKHFKEKPEGSEKKTVRVTIFPHWLCCPSTV